MNEWDKEEKGGQVSQWEKVEKKRKKGGRWEARAEGGKRGKEGGVINSGEEWENFRETVFACSYGAYR